MKIFTLGYSGWRHEELKELAERLNATIIDVRMVPRSRVPCFNAKAFKAALGERYVWLEGFGNVNYKGGPIRLKDFSGALKKLGASPDNIILMCGCSDVSICHRKVVAEKLAALWLCEIEHLARPKAVVAKSATTAADGQMGLFKNAEPEKGENQ